MRKGLQERRENGSSRLTTMDELVASYVLGQLAAAFEITLPIASARNNALAALNFLDHQPPDLGEVRKALGCLVGDADRAGDIIDRIREHIKKAPPRRACRAAFDRSRLGFAHRSRLEMRPSVPFQRRRS